MCLNKVTLIGYTGNAPTVLKKKNNDTFVRFSLATTLKYTDAEGHQQQKTQWHTVYANKGQGTALATHLQKGALLAVIGEIRYSTWKDEKTGQTRHAAGIYASDVKFLGKKPTPKEEAPSASAQQDAEMEYEMML